MEVIYVGPSCPRCSNNQYTKMMFGASEYKRCIECGRTSVITESDDLQEKQG
ncbi:hypothetical protein VPHK435_0071 [Vibrio phage K435]